MEQLAEIKLRLGITSNDDDSLIESLIRQTEEKVKRYCNRKSIPDGLSYTVISMVVDLYRFSNPSDDKRIVMEEKQGERSISYAGIADFDNVITNYKAELNRFRRVKAY